MANVSAFASKLVLDFLFKGATATQPVGVWIVPTLALPTSIAASDMATGSGISRSTLTMPAASTGNPGTVMNSSSIVFGPLSGASNSFSGVSITDSSASGAGNLLWYGSLATVRSLIIGDTLVFAVNAITAQLS